MGGGSWGSSDRLQEKEDFWCFSFFDYSCPQSESSERLERRSRGRPGRIKLLDRAQRLAQFLAQARGRLTQHAQHLLFAFRFHLLASQHFAGVSIDGFERDDVVAAERRNRAD